MKTEIQRSNTDVTDEGALVQECQRGDKKALAALFNRYRPIIEGVAFKMVRDRETAKDIIQEILLRIIKSIGTFQGDSGVGTWIYKIANNECLRILTKPSEKREVFQPLEIMDLRPSGGQDALTGAIRSQEKQLFEAALNQLEPKHKSLLVMFYHGQMGLEEIAESLGLPMGTINSRLARAKERIKEIIDFQDA